MSAKEIAILGPTFNRKPEPRMHQKNAVPNAANAHMFTALQDSRDVA